REFSDSDVLGAPKVAIINATFAKRFFDGRSPIGHRIGIGDDIPSITIAGVVADLKLRGMRDEQTPMYFLPSLQDDNPGGYNFISGLKPIGGIWRKAFAER
ncbi:MAG: ABC transporter permease, partial [Bryobacteraceae bacterium]|nr:ABC transporter permease [Bryobacteraceae bacterium]